MSVRYRHYYLSFELPRWLIRVQRGPFPRERCLIPLVVVARDEG